jgi:hypothetical protein
MKTQVETRFYLQPIEKREFKALLVTNVFFFVIRCWSQPKFTVLVENLLLFTGTPLSLVDIFIIN